MKNFTIVLAVLVLSVVAHYTVYLQGQNSTLKQMVEMANLHAKISEEMSDEILYNNILNLNNDNKEMLTQQGKIEGILAVMRNEEEYSTSWHEGYERGYHSAMKDANSHLISPEHPIIPATPRPIVSDAIKTPSFDENVKLPETDDEVNKLNIKIENLFEAEKK